VSEYPQKDYYKLSEVCQYTDTQPYILRFWESEFPQLSPDKSSSGQRVYTRDDIDLVRRIKELLYEQEYTLDGARKELQGDGKKGRRKSRTKSAARDTKKARPATRAKSGSGRGPRKASVTVSPKKKLETAPPRPPDLDTVPRGRYEDAVAEVDHLRLALKEAEKDQRRALEEVEEARRQTERERERAELAIERLEKLLEILS
jgi:DNA-binding transcriptional MerR regulator